MTKKKILHIDMDGVLADFKEAIDRLPENMQVKYEGRYKEIPGFYGTLLPINGAIKAYKELSKHFDIYILSTAPWANPSAWTSKIEWVQFWLDDLAYKNLTLTHHKELIIGDYLIDDRTKNGAGEFQGELIQFGSDEFPGWPSVTDYLINGTKQSDEPPVSQIKY